MLNLYEIIGYPLLVITAAEFILGAILLAQKRWKNAVYRSLAAMSFFSSAFALFTAVTYLRASNGLDFEIFYRATWIGWFCLPAGLQLGFYIADPKSRTARIAGYVIYPIWSVLLILCLFTDLVETSKRTLIPFQHASGPLEGPARLFGAFLAIWIIYEFYRIKKKATGIKRTQLSYYYYGTFIFGGGSAALAGFLQLFGGLGFDPALCSYFSLPWLALTVYSITRFRLFDIRIVISRTLGIALLSIIGALVHIGLFELFVPALGAVYAIVLSLMIIGALFFGTPLSAKIQQWTMDIIVRDKYDYQKAIRESIKAVTTILDLNELLSYIVESTRKSLGARTVYLFQIDDSGLRPVQNGADRAELERISRTCNEGVLQWIERKGQAVMREELDAKLSEKNERDCSVFMDGVGAGLIIPMIFKGRLQGLLALGHKINRDPYVRSDIELLQTLAGHAAIAIENARLHGESVRHFQVRIEAEKRYALEKEKLVKDLHDGIGGIMTSIASTAELALRMPADKDVAQKIAAIADLSRAGISETRGFMNLLDAGNMTWDGLIADFAHYGRMMMDSHDMSFDMTSSIDDDAGQPGSLLCLNLYMIYKEALVNIIKHAKAGNVNVGIHVGNGKLILTIRDDGAGLVRERAGGRGLANMKARAADVGGAVTITSGGGACVRAELLLERSNCRSD